MVRGLGDIGSAVAHRLFCSGYSVVINDEPKPTTTRRGMAFADAAFDGSAILEGVEAVRVPDLSRLSKVLASREAIPVYVRPMRVLLKVIQPDVLVDARMKKHSEPEPQRGLAPLTIGLGPDVVAGRHADVVVETSWERLGEVILQGASLALRGEPRVLGGHARDRYVYAPFQGVFHTKFRIGDLVREGEGIAEVDGSILSAPLDGLLRGRHETVYPSRSERRSSRWTRAARARRCEASGSDRAGSPMPFCR